MPLWKQIAEALQCQYEDFFRVRWQAVVLMLFVVACLIFSAYLRTIYPLGHRLPLWFVNTCVLAACLLALRNARRFMK